MPAIRPTGTRMGNVGENNANPVLAPDGRSVAFVSLQNFDGDTADTDVNDPSFGGETADIFRVPFESVTPERVSPDRDELPPSPSSGDVFEFFSPALSFDGRLVAFTTDAPLVPDDLNTEPTDFGEGPGNGDVYLRNLAKPPGEQGALTLVSVEADGETAAGGVPLPGSPASGADLSSPPVVVAMSDDGSYVAFLTTAAIDHDRDHNTELDVYVRDLRAPDGGSELASVDAHGKAAGVFGDPEIEGVTRSVSISFDGRYVAFATDEALIGGDGNKQVDVYVRDLNDDKTILASRIEASGGGRDPVPPAPPGFPSKDPSSGEPIGPGLSSNAVIAGKGQYRSL